MSGYTPVDQFERISKTANGQIIAIFRQAGYADMNAREEIPYSLSVLEARLTSLQRADNDSGIRRRVQYERAADAIRFVDTVLEKFAVR